MKPKLFKKTTGSIQGGDDTTSLWGYNDKYQFWIAI